MAIENPIYMEHPDLSGYQIVPDAPGVVDLQKSKGWVVKDLPVELDPDAPNIGLKVHKPAPEQATEKQPAAAPEKKTKPADSKAGQSKNEGDEK